MLKAFYCAYFTGSLISPTAEQPHQVYTRISAMVDPEIFAHTPCSSWDVKPYSINLAHLSVLFTCGQTRAELMIGLCALKNMGLQFRRVKNRPNKFMKSSITHHHLERLCWNFCNLMRCGYPPYSSRYNSAVNCSTSLTLFWYWVRCGYTEPVSRLKPRATGGTVAFSGRPNSACCQTFLFIDFITRIIKRTFC